MISSLGDDPHCVGIMIPYAKSKHKTFCTTVMVYHSFNSLLSLSTKKHNRSELLAFYEGNTDVHFTTILYWIIRQCFLNYIYICMHIYVYIYIYIWRALNPGSKDHRIDINYTSIRRFPVGLISNRCRTWGRWSLEIYRFLGLGT